MNVTLNAQINSNQVNFMSLKKVSGRKELNRLVGPDGLAIEEMLVGHLKENKSFKSLCDKYDVYVNIAPHDKQADIMPDKRLSMMIFASKIKNGGIIGLFRKSSPKEIVSGHVATGIEAKTWDLANHIIDDFIKPKEGMELDINKFFEKANTAK